MKITFVIYSLGPGGAERAVTGLANNWCADHEVSIITLIKTQPFYSLKSKVGIFYCLEKTQTKTNFFLSIKNGLYRIHRLLRILKSQKPHVVLSFMHSSNIYTILAAKWLRTPCIISERSNHDIDKLSRTQEIIRNLIYPFCSKLIVQTNGNKEYYSKVITESKIYIIPNAISPELKAKRLTIKRKEQIILNVGSFRNGKAQDILIRAFAKINKNDWRLVFLGDGPNLEYCKKLANKMDLSEQIDFMGTIKNVASYYNKAATFVFTSEHEGFPNALLEALYFGVPSISTNCPHGPSDMIKDGVNGFLVSVGDENKLVEKMELLIKNKDLRKSLSKKAIESTKKYEMESISQQWLDVIIAVTR